MPGSIILYICLIFIVAAYWLDARRKPDVSWALWVPLIWLILASTKPVALWMNPTASPMDLIEGNSVDRTIQSILIGLGIVILVGRRSQWLKSFTSNRAVVLLLLYMGCAVLWSDFETVAFKRYIRMLGLVAMVLIVLTEQNLLEAIRTIARRSSYALLPLSVVLFKYFPNFGVRYSPWGGREIIGVATGKNMLGLVCLIFGFILLYSIVCDVRDQSWRRHRLRFSVDIFVLSVALYILWVADSKTSLVCFLVGAVVLWALKFPGFRSRIGTWQVITGIVYFSLEWVFGITSTIATLLGRPPTLTGRTEIWRLLWEHRANVWIGAGYDSFWLGGTREMLQGDRIALGAAHSGYLEIILSLGLVGLFLFAMVIISAHRNNVRLLNSHYEVGALMVSLLVVILLHNVAESGLPKPHIMTFCLFLVSMRSSRSLQSVSLPQRGKASVAYGETVPGGTGSVS